jgi:DNA-binding winged helix-turn-helix (wHTH) protein/tetratricopeptide (TPR) repeat protein
MTTWRFGEFAYDPRRRRLSRAGAPVELPPKAVELLQLLLESGGRVVEKTEIFDALWPDTAVQESNLTQTVYVLRKALGDAREAGEYVQTVPRRGYRFVAEVEAEPETAEPAEAVTAPPAEAVTAVVPGRTRAWAWTTLVLAAVLIAASVAWTRRPRAAAGAPDAAAPAQRDALEPLAAPRRSVAVLALRNAAARPEVAWLGTALAEMITTELGANRRLRPISGEAVSRTRRELKLADADALAPDTLRRLRDRLGADLVVSGAYLVVGDGRGRKLRVDVRVQETGSGETLASLAQTGTDEELIELAGRLGSRVLETMGGAAPGATREASGLPETPEALRSYAEGLDRLRAFDAVGARERLERAAALSPRSPLAHLALSHAWRALGHDLHARESALEADRLAGALSPERRLTIEAHRLALTNEWEKAAALYASLARLFPDDVEHVLRWAEAQTRAGRPRDALASVGRARESPSLDAGDPRLALAEAEAQNTLGDNAAQGEATGRALAQARVRGARYLEATALSARAWTARNAGRADEAERDAERASAIFAAAGDRNQEALALNTVAAVRHDLGRYDEAEALWKRCLALRRAAGNVRGSAIVQNNLATVLVWRGRFDEARAAYAEVMRVAVEVGDRRMESMARFNVGKIRLDEGQVEEARLAYEQALAAARQAADRSIQSLVLLDLARVALAQARLADAEDLLGQTVRLSAEIRFTLVERAAVLTRFDILKARGEHAAARRVAEELRALQEKEGKENGAREAEAALADLMVDEGQAEEAEVLARRAYEHWKRKGNSVQQGTAALHLARALWSQGQRDEARRLFDEALAAIWRAGLRLDYADMRAEKARLEGLAGAAASLATLQELLAEAQRRGWSELELSVALALGEVEMKQQPERARPRLLSLAEDAHRKGFTGVARRAEQALGPARAAAATR